MKRHHPVWILSAILALSTHAFAIEYGVRTWTSADGRKLEAQLVEGDETTARLKLAATGKVVPVPLTRLSEEDRAYTKTWVAEMKSAWKLEITKAEKVDAFKNPKQSSNEVIKPTEGQTLFLVEILITPPEGLVLPMFDDLKAVLVHDSGEAIAKYVRPRRPGDTAEGEPGEGVLLYEIPEEAKPVALRYKDNPPISPVSARPKSLLDR